MANPLYNELKQEKPQQDPTFGFNGMIQHLRQYAGNFQGDPQQALQNMLSSGQMNQQQYNQLRGVAQQIAQMITS